MSRGAKGERVEAVLRELVRTSHINSNHPYALSNSRWHRFTIVCCEQDLEGCANTMIGDETLGMKGISGGQRRRVGIGLELVKDPRLVFLDEVVHQLPRPLACP